MDSVTTSAPPRISVIIPAWNAGKYLRRATESLLATRYPDLEIIIVDDASTDDTASVAARLRDEHPAVVRTFSRPREEPRGAAAARNLGIEKSTGDYIAFLDADDWVYPWRFEETVAILSTNPAIDGVYGTCDLVCADNHALDIHVGNAATANRLPSNQGVTFAEFIAHGLWLMNAVTVRRRLFERTGVFDPAFPIGQDSHLWYRMALLGVMQRVRGTRSLAVYFRHPGNRYAPGHHHDLGRHNVELIGVWRWAIQRGLHKEATDVYQAWREQWCANACLMARFHYFRTGWRLWRDALANLGAREWLTVRPYVEILRVATAFARHGAGYVLHGKWRRAAGTGRGSAT